MKYLLFLFNYVFISNCVLRSKFKTCEQSGFCKRIYSEKLHTDRFIAKDVVCKSGKISANLYDQYLMAELVFNAFALKNNRLRIHITEKNPKHPRFDIFEHAWRNHQDEPSIDKGTTIIQQNASACEFKLNSNTIQINFEPFLINIINDKKELIISLNTKNGFLIEPNIKKITNQPTKDNNITDEAYIPHETFDGHSDTLPHGYQAVSFDATFHNFEHVFGIPEHADTFSLNSNHARYRLFNLDVFEYELYNQMALYGSVPFMVAKNIEQTIGLLFLNAAEMWVSINKISKSSLLSYLGLNKKRIITEIDTRWVAESGNIDIILMLGKEPKDVLYQYSLTTGFPNLPPLFAIAYHQCRWNYNDAQDVNRVDDTFDKYTIPYDVIWLDIEHTPSRQYFLFDDIKFPNHHQTILNISNKGRKMVTVVDPHVKKSQSYYVYNEVIEHGFDLKTATNNTYVGWCWPGDSIYVNYMKQEVRKWYANQFDVNRYKGTTIDVHTWVDMNEPSVFNGPEVTIPKDTHNGEWENRDFHNLYGQMCIDATYQGGLLRGKYKLRPFVLARSFFSGSQKYGAVWTGDNLASWEHLKITIPMLLSLSIAGIPFAGADVSGFFKDPSPELFYRWYQSASMQPFFRAHSHIETKRREPWSFGSPITELVKDQILRRYRYLPYFYTLFYEASKHGQPIMRPLWYEFPTDLNTLSIEDSYMLGSSLLIKPIVEPGVTSVHVYFPKDKINSNFWWGLFNNQKYIPGSEHNINMPSISDLPMFQRSGSIIPTWERQRRASSKMIHDPITLNIVVDENGIASGTFYLDDTESFDYLNAKFVIFSFQLSNNLLTGGTIGFYSTDIWLERIRIYNFNKNIIGAYVTSYGKSTKLDVIRIDEQSIIIRRPYVKLKDGFLIKLIEQK